MKDAQFTKFIREQGDVLFRPMPWRTDTQPYYILLSELMLQQTQVARVIPKFNEFIAVLPTIEALAQAPLSQVITLWQGLGYNRRAKYLHDSAQYIVATCNSLFPSHEQELLKLPGVGKNTAGAICAYAFNQPALFIETNIRTVYIYHFFTDQVNVSDAAIMDIVQRTLDRKNPRQFYWALMDYGAHLKARGIKTTVYEKNYTKQPKLAGSVRQVRGQIIKVLAANNGYIKTEVLRTELQADERFTPALAGLVRDGLVRFEGDNIVLA